MLLIKRIFLAFLIFILPLVVFASEEGARSFVVKTADDALKIVENTKLSPEEKQQELNKIFEDVVDIEWVGRFAMGQYWREATDEQKQEYLELYKKFLIQSYVPNFRSYTNQRLDILSSLRDSEGEYTVQTEFNEPNKPSIRVDYKIRQNSEGTYEIFDIVAEGVSMITTQRSDFGSILSRKGIKHLIKLLKNKVSN